MLWKEERTENERVRGGQKCCIREVLKLQQYLDKSFLKVLVLKVWVVFVQFFKNINRSDIFLFPSLFFHCSFWLEFSAFLSAPNQCLQDSSLFNLCNSLLTGPGSVLCLAWLGGVTRGSLHGNSHCAVIYYHRCGFKLTHCTT